MNAQLKPAPAPEAVDVLAVLDAAITVTSARLTEKRREFDRTVLRGKEPHEMLVIKIERAEYIRAQLRDARDAVAELLDAAAYALRTRDEAGALTSTADYNLHAALALIGGAE